MDLLFEMFSLGDVDGWTSVKVEVEAWNILNHLFLETVTGTCTHLMERRHPFLHICAFVVCAIFKWECHIRGYLLPHIYTNKYGTYLEVDLICSKAMNRKQDKIFFKSALFSWQNVLMTNILIPKSLCTQFSHLVSSSSDFELQAYLSNV